MRRLAVIAVMLLVVTAFGTLGMHYVTGAPWLESLYLAVVTLSTVGNRDPAMTGSPAAMVFTMAYLVCGFGIFTYGAFQLGQALITAQYRGLWERRRMNRELAALRDHYIVCGLGRMGSAICEYLHARKRPFVIVDRDPARLEQVAREAGWLHLEGDATDDDVLRRAGIDRASALATVLPTDADNLYVTMSARLLSATVKIVCRAGAEGAIVKMERAGATRVISPFHSAGVKMARIMLNPSVEDFIEVTDSRHSDLELVELDVRSGNPLAGKTLSESDLRRRGLNVIGIRKAGASSIVTPSAETQIVVGDTLFVFGSNHALTSLLDERLHAPTAAPLPTGG